MVIRVRETLAAAAQALAGDEARLEAEVLLLHVLGQPRAWLYAHADDELPLALHEAFAPPGPRPRVGAGRRPPPAGRAPPPGGRPPRGGRRPGAPPPPPPPPAVSASPWPI